MCALSQPLQFGPFVVIIKMYTREVFASGDARLTGFLQVPNCGVPHRCIYYLFFFT